MTFAYRPLSEDSWDSWIATNARGFLADVGHAAEWGERVRPLVEFDRSLGAFDGAELVGKTQAISFTMSVPGGDLPTAGVTAVTVLPTHRRRGVLTELMRRQLDDVRDRGEPFAALWASESLIYGRFGYGMAAQAHDLRIDRRHTTLTAPADPGGAVRFVTRDEALERWPPLHERARATRAGMMARVAGYWSGLTLPSAEKPEAGFSQSQLVEYTDAGDPQGYAIYAVKGADGPGGLPAGALRLDELIALNGRAEAALWRYLFGVDLIETIEAPNRPPDDALFWMLADPRRLQRHPHDSLWLRLLDVPRALEARAWPAEGRLTLDVRDPFGPWAQGRFELVAEGGRAICRPLAAAVAPDLALGASDLATVCLGGARPSVLARAARVEGSPQALRLADALFAWRTAPWCADQF